MPFFSLAGNGDYIRQMNLKENLAPVDADSSDEEVPLAKLLCKCPNNDDDVPLSKLFHTKPAIPLQNSQSNIKTSMYLFYVSVQFATSFFFLSHLI